MTPTETIRQALEFISRMKSDPDKVICMMTISEAARIANSALTALDGMAVVPKIPSVSMERAADATKYPNDPDNCSCWVIDADVAYCAMLRAAEEEI